jgi:ribonuclease BN (tRNA processing enzyme)
MNFWHRRFHDSLLIAHPVGDGNALELQNWGTALMDCGGDDRALQVLHSASARGMSEFLLTHLHADHYSGITKQPAGTKLSFDVDHIFLPALPLIGNRGLTANFALALFTMNVLLGSKSGIPEQDLIDSFASLNPRDSKPSHTFLSKGDSFDLAGTPFQVLWPPRAVSGLVAQAAQEAVDEFEKAIGRDERAREIRDRLTEQASQAADRAEQHAANEVDIVDDAADSDASTDVEKDSESERYVPESLRSANRAIRDVANRLSLAFRCGSRLIHLGDLESAELNQVATDLEGATDFFGMIAAHHGTHFARNMNSLSALHLVVSNGNRRPHLKADYRKIASYIQETNVHGHSFLVF